MLTSLQRAAALATIIAISAATGALAQETAADPSQPDATEAETMPSTGGADSTEQTQDTQSDQSDMMSGPMDQPTTGQGMMCSEGCSGMMAGMGQGATEQEMMSQRMRGQGRMDEAMQSGHMGSGMHDHMMKIVFAIADADGNGGMSLDELSDIQGRMFNAVDANEDGSVTPEELQSFIGG